MFLDLPDPDPVVRGRVADPNPNPDPHVFGLLDPDPDPDPLVRGTDPRILMYTEMSWIRNTERKGECLRELSMLLSL
jgi:hypothetical protein